MVKIATWNVNSLRVRLDQVLAWLAREQPDILALQETKLEDALFPHQAFADAGYSALCAGQRTYNGVATLSRLPAAEGAVITELPGLDDPQRRVLGSRHGPLQVLNLYVPNGAAVGSEKYEYKLRWLDALVDFIPGLLRESTGLVVLGDFNIAPEDRDVHDPEAWRGQVLVSEPERQRLRRLLDAGLVDGFRRIEPEQPGFSWWDYRAGAFRRNMGLRIDLILLSAHLAQGLRHCRVDSEPRRAEKPSDHAPVVAELEIDAGPGLDPACES